MSQNEALRALEWLMSDRPEDQRTGRSTVEAVALLRHAVRRGGFTQIAITDARDQHERRHQVSVLVDVATRLGIEIKSNGPSEFKLVYPISDKALNLLLTDPFPWSILNNGSPVASNIEKSRRTRAERLNADDVF